MSALPSKFDLHIENRRSESRPRVIMLAKLVYGGFSPSVVDCAVRNLSEGGACLETDVMVQLPDIFYVHFNGKADRKARRCWARGNQIGLEFLNEAA